MNCQNCGKNEATIHLYTSVNGQKRQFDLCQNCYQKLKANQGSMNQNMYQDPFGFSNFDDLLSQFSRQMQQNPQNQQVPPTQSGFMGGQPPRQGQNGGNGLLDQFGVNITQQARDGKIDPVIGRDQEINRVIEILNRRNKNNPVLIGEPGVGKTAVVEGLALKIVAEEVPQKLQGKEVIRLDVASLVQGTGIRGQFEERMQQLIQEVTNADNIILFIDEVHEIVGAGSAGEGALDAGNILKPSLARGELQLIGATTLNEYRMIEKDPALERRMQPVQVNEPSVEETITILKGIQKRYEDYHHVKYTDEAIEQAAILSNRYIQDRFLPDKAIDLLDEAGSKKNLTIAFVDPKSIEKKLDYAQQQKREASQEEDFEKAAYYRDQITKLEKLMKTQVEDEEMPFVTEKDMEKIVEEKTGIPVGDLKEKEQTQLKNLADDLNKRVIGQQEAVEKVSKAIRRNRIGLGKVNRPIGSFLFVGLTEKVRRNPYSLILLDEIEKAHPDVLHMFLQILDDGRLTDAKGRTVSFKDTIIIMTSNAGAGKIEASVGFGAAIEGRTKSVLGQLNQFFTPEFLNRFDGIVEFKALSKENLLLILDLMLSEVNEQLARQEIHVDVDDAVKEKLVELGYNPAMGARPLRRVIQDKIEDQVAECYLDAPDVKNMHAVLDENGEIIVKAAE